MSDPEKLGGFKVLKEAVLLSVDPVEPGKRLPLAPFRTLAEHRINLSYVTCVLDRPGKWRVNMVVDFKDKQATSHLLSQALGRSPRQLASAAILSIFPHRKRPAIAGALCQAFGREGIHPEALTHSPSAISAVVNEQEILQASSALFGPFAFGAYRTPADWKLAQNGKEKLYKEVVASYQEKFPKVYGLEYQDHQELLHITLSSSGFKTLGAAFEDASQSGLDLTFLVTNRSLKKAETVDMCLPLAKRGSSRGSIAHILKPSRIETDSPVGTFSMNGPHFGDRYGIIETLLNTLEASCIHLLGLSCTIASITGVVPSSQLTKTIGAIQNCFDVPSVIKIEREYD